MARPKTNEKRDRARVKTMKQARWNYIGGRMFMSCLRVLSREFCENQPDSRGLWGIGGTTRGWPFPCWRWSSPLRILIYSLTIWCEEPTHWQRPWCWEWLKAGEGDDRRWDRWMASPTQWTWVWASSGRRWRTGRPGALQSMWPRRVETAERLNYHTGTTMGASPWWHIAQHKWVFHIMQPLRGKWTNNQSGLAWAPSWGRNPTGKSTLLSHVAARWLLWVVLLHNQPPVERLTCYWRPCPLSSHICTNFWLLIVFQGRGSLGSCLTTFRGHTMGTSSQRWGPGKNNSRWRWNTAAVLLIAEFFSFFLF